MDGRLPVAPQLLVPLSCGAVVSCSLGASVPHWSAVEAQSLPNQAAVGLFRMEILLALHMHARTAACGATWHCEPK